MTRIHRCTPLIQAACLAAALACNAASAQQNSSTAVGIGGPTVAQPKIDPTVSDVRLQIGSASIALQPGAQQLVKLIGTSEHAPGTQVLDGIAVPSCSQPIGGKLNLRINYGNQFFGKPLTLDIQVGAVGNFVWQQTFQPPIGQSFTNYFQFSEGVSLPLGLHLITMKFQQTQQALQVYGVKLECVPMVKMSAGVVAVMPDTTPAPFTVPNVVNVAPGQVVESAPVTISGINTEATIEVLGCLSLVNGAPATKVKNGEALRLRMTAPTAPDTWKTCNLRIGGYTTQWGVKTLTPDLTPDPFEVPAVSGAQPGALVTSAAVTVTGIDYPATVVTAISGCALSVANEPFVTSTTIQNGQSFRVQATAAQQHGQVKSCSFWVGNAYKTWSVTTLTPDVTPNNFQFPNKSDAYPGAVVESDALAITGIDTPVTVEFAPGTVDCEHQINNGAWSAQPGTITNNQPLRLRAKAVLALGQLKSCSFKVGTVQSQWGVFTTVNPPTPTPTPVLKFPNPVPLNQPVSSNTVTVTLPYAGGAMTVGASQVGMDCKLSVNNGPWTSANTPLPANQPVSVRVQVTVTGPGWPPGGYCGGKVGSAPYQATPQ